MNQLWTGKNATVRSNQHKVLCVARQVMQQAKCVPARRLKDRNEFLPTKQKEVAGPDMSAARHQDSETSPKWETVWVALLSDPCAIYYVTKAIMYELATPLDAPLPLGDLAVSNLHKQHSLIHKSKIYHCLPQLQITMSKRFSPPATNSTHLHISLSRHVLF